MAVSARRAWHDCYFISSLDSVEQLKRSMPKQVSGKTVRVVREKDEENGGTVVAANIPLMFAKQDQTSKPDFFNHWDGVAKGRVQGVIKRLPRDLQTFGHYMYGPAMDDDLDDLKERVFGIVYNRVVVALEEKASKWRESTRRIAQAIVLATIEDWRYTVFGGNKSRFERPENDSRIQGSLSYSPYAIKRWCFDWYGVDFEAKNWARDYAHIYDASVRIINDMELQALGPIAKLFDDHIS